MRIGVLALQGCVEPHLQHLQRLQVQGVEVRQPKDLQNLNALILPGGESTTMIRLLKQFSLWEELPALAEKIPFWGICAGSILMAETVENPAQESLSILPICVRRNAYGRQLDSFQGSVTLTNGQEKEAVFIRAPKFVSWTKDTEVLGTTRGDAVFLSYRRHLVTAFHPELLSDSWCHEILLERAKALSGRIAVSAPTVSTAL